MRIVVDTNIVFSALMNANNTMGEILLNLQTDIHFFAPELLRIELQRYKDKLKKHSKLSEDQMNESFLRILGRITLIAEELISQASWDKAFELTKDVDEDDTPFVALALELKAKLWTGDKKLAIGLQSKESGIILSTNELANYFN